MSEQKKNRWDKIAKFLQASGGLIAAITVAGVGYLGSSFLAERQDREARVRLYTELISKREEAESALRKDMFTNIIGSFLNPDESNLNDKILQLELLASNFHESLNLEPLFLSLKRQVDMLPDKNAKDEYTYRLKRIANEIVSKQKAILEKAGTKDDFKFGLETIQQLHSGKNGNEFRDQTKKSFLKKRRKYFSIPVLIENDTAYRHGSLTLINVDRNIDEVEVRLMVCQPVKESDINKASDNLVVDSEQTFWLGPFDFPMIDNTRLSEDQRCAVIINNISHDNVRLSVMCFPGAHASLKEKPYYDELVEKLLPKEEEESGFIW
jgi:hypothetical protein